MMENSGEFDEQCAAVDACCLNDQELILLVMFRVASPQRQRDVLRMLEVFIKLSE